MQQNYYVYLLIDPRTSQPFYVGKGCENRMFYHELSVVRNYKDAVKPHHNRIREILNEGLKIVYEKVLLNVSESKALIKEHELTDHYGRVNNGTGILLNVSSGGHRGGAVEKPVSQYQLDGIFLKTYPSAKVASEYTNANRSYITQCCKGKRRSAGGFLWCYKDSSPPIYHKQYYRKVEQQTLTGKHIAYYPSLTAAQNHTGIELHNISECCRHKSKTAGGFVWHYA